MVFLRGQKEREGWAHALSWCLHAQECEWARQGLARRVGRPGEEGK